MARVDCSRLCLSLLLLLAVFVFASRCQRAEAKPISERSVPIPNAGADAESSGSTLSPAAAAALRAPEEAAAAAQQRAPSSGSTPTGSARSGPPHVRRASWRFARRRRAIQWPHFDERDFYDVAADISRSSNPAVIRHYAKFIHDNIGELIHDVCRCAQTTTLQYTTLHDTTVHSFHFLLILH